MTNAIAVEGLRKSLNKVEAVAGLSFSIQQGEAVHEHVRHEIDRKQESGQPLKSEG